VAGRKERSAARLRRGFIDLWHNVLNATIR
jgi:hypothetical protein